MNVADSTPGATPVASTATEITPPSPSSTSDERPKEQLLASLRAEIRMLRARVDGLEAERRRFIQPTTTAPSTHSPTTSAPPGANAALTTTPGWRTKTGKQAGWQPARR